MRYRVFFFRWPELSLSRAEARYSGTDADKQHPPIALHDAAFFILSNFSVCLGRNKAHGLCSTTAVK